jgi:hypothetical protein
MSNLKPLQRDAIKIYGNPTGVDGHASPTWESRNLTYVYPPFPMRMGDIPITRVKVHKLVAGELDSILKEIWAGCNEDIETIKKLHIDRYSGAYNYRAKRGGSSLSMHAYGVAIDFDASNNMMGKPGGFFKQDHILVKTFKKYGWTWGGDWSGKSYDPQHFQCPKIK